METSASSVSQQMDTQTVQAVTLADGTTAFIQHPKGLLYSTFSLKYVKVVDISFTLYF